MMAAHEPATDQRRSPWTGRGDSSIQSAPNDVVAVNTDGLEIGMSGMSLVSNVPPSVGSGHERKETGSTIASSPSDSEVGGLGGGGGRMQPPPPLPITTTTGGGDQHSVATRDSSAPSSPVPAQQGGVSRPPGMGGGSSGSSLPSPIGKQERTSLATSPLLTLTPNSSVDGGNSSDWNSMAGRQAATSPFQQQNADAPTIPFLEGHRRGGGGGQQQHQGQGGGEDGAGIAHFGSFDLAAAADSDNDGLLGLEALRDRAYSSPGPAPAPHHGGGGIASSPPVVMRGHLPAHVQQEMMGQQQQQQQQERERPRSATRDRPPLSHSAYAEQGGGGGGGDNRNGVSVLALPFQPPTAATNRAGVSGGGSDAVNSSLDSGDSRSGFGAIGRPDVRLPGGGNEYQPQSRRRATSSDNYSGVQDQHDPGAGGVSDPSQKFGSLPSLGSHIQHQRQQSEGGFEDVHRPRHVRSVSVPSNHLGAHAASLPPAPAQHNKDPQLPRLYTGTAHPNNPSHSSSHSEGGSHHMSSGGRRGTGSMSQPAIPTMYDNNNTSPHHHHNAYTQKRPSMPNMGYAQGPQPSNYQNVRRDGGGMEYADTNSQSSGQHQQMHGGEMRAPYGGVPSMISPGHSPMQMQYASHSRHPSDSGSAILSSSPGSPGSGLGRGQSPMQPSSGPMHQHFGREDDLTHPLVGEHIEVPAEHNMAAGVEDPHMYGSYMMQQQQQAHPLLRGPQQQQQHPQYGDPQQQHPQYGDPSAHHLPTAGAAMPMPKVVYSIKFKRTQRNFVLGPRISRDLKIGTYVKVEADRGEDLGIVVGKVSMEKYNFSRTSYTAGMGPPPGSLSAGGGGGDLKRIIRLATHDEVSLLGMKRDEEEELLNICRTKVRQRGLPMHVVDAEYQFDRHKLTFFFEAEGRVDFRELVRDLFSIYKTRIWMQQLDKNTATSAQAFMSPQQPAYQMDYGVPIIAPVSEFADSIVLPGMASGDSRSPH